MLPFRRSTLWGLFIVLLVGCAHAPPRLVQVFSQVNRVFDPGTKGWESRLAVFVQASSADGTKVFDRLHLVHDAKNLYLSLPREQWTPVEKPGEFWVGTTDVTFPDGEVPPGTWRVLLVTRSGQTVETTFELPPQPPTAPGARTGVVTAKPDPKKPGGYLVSGWVDDYLVWARDAKGTVFSRNKTVGPGFTLPPGTLSFVLYSYDKNRGEGLEAGPFPVQDAGVSADR